MNQDIAVSGLNTCSAVILVHSTRRPVCL